MLRGEPNSLPRVYHTTPLSEPPPDSMEAVIVKFLDSTRERIYKRERERDDTRVNERPCVNKRPCVDKGDRASTRDCTTTRDHLSTRDACRQEQAQQERVAARESNLTIFQKLTARPHLQASDKQSSAYRSITQQTRSSRGNGYLQIC